MTSQEMKKLARTIARHDRQILALSATPQLAYSSIESGNVKSYDVDGNLKMTIGLQDDGGNTISVISGPVPPTPVGFTVDVDYGQIRLHWNGGFEGDQLVTSDWSRTEVYAEQGTSVAPSRSTARGSMVAASGGEVKIGVEKGTWTVCLVAWSQAGKMSAASAPVTVDVPGYGDLVQAALDEAQALIDEAKAALEAGQSDLADKITAAETALAALESTLADLDETTLPALRQDLDAAEGRLDSAEGQITDAFGELALVPGQITDATQDALIAAATDAQARADAAQAAADEAARAYAEAIATGIEPVDLDALRTFMETKAAQAKQAAIDAAALDATAKANAAKSQAQAWDEALSTSINNTIDGAVDDLSADIAAVQTSADGKNKITWDSAAPTLATPGKAVNDIWYRTSGNSIIGYWKWSGSAWVQQTLSATVIPQIDIGTGTFGNMSGSRLDVGSVLADRVLVGAGRNMIPWPQVLSGATTEPHRNEDWYGAGTVSIAPADPDAGVPRHILHNRLSNDPDIMRRIMYFLPGPQQYGSLRGTDGFAVVGGEWRFQLTAYTHVANMYASLMAIAYNAQGQWAAAKTSTSENIWATPKQVSLDITLPASAAYIVLYLQTNQPGEFHVVNPEFFQRTTGELIVDGAITTDKLAANVLEVGNLKAGTAAIAEAVVQKIAAQTASIQTADIKNLFVTGTSSLSNVVAERIAAETAEFIELEVGNLVAGTGTMDTATINKLFADVVVAGMSIATEFIGENAILTGAVTAPKITASEELWAKIGEFVKIRAEQLEADAIDGMVITGPNIRTAASGARVQLDAGGLSVYDSLDDWQVRLTPDGSSFKGDLEAESLVANGAAEFKSTDNMLAQGAKLTLAAGVADPTAPPIVQPYWDGLEFTPTVGKNYAGLAWADGKYWTFEDTPSIADGDRLVSIDPTTGAIGDAIPMTGGFWAAGGVTAIGSELFMLGRKDAAAFKYFVRVYSTAGVFLREWEYMDVGWSATNKLVYKPGIGNNGADVVIAQCDDLGRLIWRTYSKTTGALLITTSTPTGDATKSDISGIYIGPADWGGGNFVTIAKTATKALPSFTTSGVYAPERSWRMADDASETGIVFADGKFRTLNASGVIREYADGGTGDGSGDWWCAYRWETDTDSDGTIDYRSKISPPARFTWPRRARLKATGQPKPVGVELMAGFLAKKATKPARTDFKRNYTGYSTTRSIAYWDWYQNTGDAPADGNNYPTATPSSVASASGTFQVNGDGSGKWGPLTFNPDGTMSSSAVPAWIPITAFLNSWTVGDFGFAPAYRVWPDGKVEWRGVVKGPAATAPKPIINIPTNARPAQYVPMGGACNGGGGNPGWTRIDVNDPDAANVIRLNPQAGSVTWASLDLIEYYKN